MFTTGWYGSVRNRLKSSSIRRFYWAIANRESLVSSRREEEFYRKLLVGLRRDDLVIDVGSNQGAKADVFLRLGARVMACDPDDANQAVLRDRFLRYRLKPRPVVVVGKAISDKVGIEEMWIDGPGSAVNTFSRKWADHLKANSGTFRYEHFGLDFSRSKAVETTTIEDIVSQYGVPFFVKIDVEGHELSVIRGMRRPVPFLSFEVNLRAFRKEGIECVEALNELKPDGDFNYTPDCCSGLVLKEWLGSEEFCRVLDSCTDETIEVFWRSNCSEVRSEVRV